MKKAISVILVLCLMLSLSVSAFAAELAPTVDKKSIAAGDDVEVTLSFNNKIENVVTIAYRVYFDSDVFTFKSKTNGNDSISVSTGNMKSDDTGSYMTVSTMDDEYAGQTLEGTLCKLTFTAKEDVAEESASSFRLQFERGLDNTGATITHTAGAAASVTVTPKAADPEYTLTMGEDKTVKANENVMIPVTVGYTTDAVTSFNAVDMQFSYDTTKLEYVSVSDTTNYTVKAENGTVRVQGYGKDKALGEAFTLTFKALSSTDENGTLVTATSAKIDEAKNAVTENAPEAKLLRESTKITIDGAVYNVTLPAGQFTGDGTVNAGEDYTFKASNEYYDYSNVTATMGGAAATVKDNGDGTYTIENVTGDITVDKVLGKKYAVTVTGSNKDNFQGVEEARYGEKYSFLIKNIDTDTYDYSVTVTIGGKSYTPEINDRFVSMTESITYTISGDAITGNIEIVATRTLKGQNTTQISFTGSGAAEVEGGAAQTATNGQDFKFTVNKEDGYDYTVKLGDEVLTAGTDGKYTIPAGKLTGTALTVTVEKTFSAQSVNVQKYVNLNNTSIWLVSVSGDPGTDKVFTYDNKPMYTSTKYAPDGVEGGTHVYLVIAETLTTTDAAKNVAVANGTAAGAVDYEGDVNGSKTVDINDAQLVYDMYNAKYANFDAVTMYKFLCADVSDEKPDGATLLNVTDAVAVVDIINK